jgi:hypothetical protein
MLPNQPDHRWASTGMVRLVAPTTLALLLYPMIASAQDLAAAEALFREGKSLMTARDYAKACPKLAESQRLDPSAGTALNLAACHEKQGKSATAWADYLVAARIAKQQSKPAIVQEATARAAQIEPELSHLIVRPPQGIAGLEITRDGIAMDAGSLDSKIPVDPGPHQIRARAPGYRQYEVTVTVGAARDDKVVAIPQLEQEGAAAAAPGAPVASPGPTAVSVAPVAPPAAAQPAPATAPAITPVETTPAPNVKTPDTGAGSSQRTLGYVVGGVGVLALGAGTVLGVVALGKHSNATNLCPSSPCSSREGVDAQQSARSLAWAANIGFGVGLVGVGTAAYLLLTSGGSTAGSGQGVRILPMGSADSGGVIAMGIW